MSSYKCSDVPSTGTSQSACANANDICRYEDGKCVTTITKGS